MHPDQLENLESLRIRIIQTPLGEMVAVGDEHCLYCLEFADSLKKLMSIPFGHARSTELITCELSHYFEGTLERFTTPVCFLGTPFQHQVWSKLCQISYAATCSYADLSIAIGKTAACRAVGLANKANKLAIIVPCHRVIHANRSLGGYNGGVARKRWLLDHEKKITRSDIGNLIS